MLYNPFRRFIMDDILNTIFFEDFDFVENINVEDVKLLREKYTKNPPEGYTSKDIANMSDNDILDMDYFLNE